ncbi:MAG: DNA-binding response regulator [Planctomycetota bacterium]|nr:MAG: DNA-binding response regulator [Planctomycetota bacterium]
MPYLSRFVHGGQSTMGETAGVILVGATELDRRGYELLLDAECGIRVAAACDATAVAIWEAMRHKPGIAIVLADVSIPETQQAVQMIPRLHRSTRLLVLSENLDPHTLAQWARCDIHAYVLKHGGVSELQAALDALKRHERYFSSGVKEAIANGRKLAGRTKLSRREAELLPLLARGLTLREAAARMSVSYKTADTYRTSLLRKLGVRDRVGLARFAIRERIIDP